MRFFRRNKRDKVPKPELELVATPEPDLEPTPVPDPMPESEPEPEARPEPAPEPTPESTPDPTLPQPQTEADFMAMLDQANALFEQGQMSEAELMYTSLVNALDAGLMRESNMSAEELSTMHAMIRTHLGKCLTARGEYRKAVVLYRQALNDMGNLDKTDAQNLYADYKIHVNMGDTLRRAMQFGLAQNAFMTALGLAKFLNDAREISRTLSKQGLLAMQQFQFDVAEVRYTEAVDVCPDDDPLLAHTLWYQLGRVAQEQARSAKADATMVYWDKAERCFQRALELAEHTGDTERLASTYNQRADVALRRGCPDDAEQWYVRTIELSESLEDPHQLAGAFNSIANFYMVQERLDEAETYARRAKDLKQSLDLSAEPWTTYAILVQIAEARGQLEAFGDWRQREHESYAASPIAAQEMLRYQPMLKSIAAACDGNPAGVQRVMPLLSQMAHFDEERRRFADMAVLILQGERDPHKLTSQLGYREALMIRIILKYIAEQEQT